MMSMLRDLITAASDYGMLNYYLSIEIVNEDSNGRKAAIRLVDHRDSDEDKDHAVWSVEYLEDGKHISVAKAPWEGITLSPVPWVVFALLYEGGP